MARRILSSLRYFAGVVPVAERKRSANTEREVPASFARSATLQFSPGKPFILARAVVNGRTVCLVGLPGHVTSALVCARVFLAPLLEHLQGHVAGNIRQGIAHYADLALPQHTLGTEPLAVEIALVKHIVIHQPDDPHTGAGQQFGHMEPP